MEYMTWFAFVAAEVGVWPILLAVIGTGGLSAIGATVLSFRRMKVQNAVDFHTIAKEEVDTVVQGFRDLLGVQAVHLKLQADQIERQNTQIQHLRDVIERCERKCAELTVEVRKRDSND